MLIYTDCEGCKTSGGQAGCPMHGLVSVIPIGVSVIPIGVGGTAVPPAQWQACTYFVDKHHQCGVGAHKCHRRAKDAAMGFEWRCKKHCFGSTKPNEITGAHNP